MQNQTLPIQLSPLAVAPAPSRVNPQPNTDGAGFSQTLNREMAQRQSAAAADRRPDTPAPAPPRPAQGAKPASPAAQPVKAEKHMANEDNATADAVEAAPADGAATTPAAAGTETVAADAAPDAGAAAAADAAVAPMTDMLALVASYQHLMQGGAAKPAAATTDAADKGAAVRTSGVAADTQTLAALQSALKKAPDAGADTGTDTGAGAGKQAPQEDADPGAAAKPRTAPDLATVASRAAPQSEAAMSTLRDAAVKATVKDTAPVTGSAFQAQLSSVAMAQAAVTPASDHIPARLGSTAWDTQVSQRVVWMVGGADQTASLTLNPPDLGPVQVVLNVNNDQATVAFSSATPEVRAALENAMPRLREMLGEAGVTLGEASVSANMPDQRQADTSQGNGARGGNNGGGNGAGANGVRSGESEIPVPRTASRAVRDDGVVDTFA